jgi:hypothetical protein
MTKCRTNSDLCANLGKRDPNHFMRQYMALDG